MAAPDAPDGVNEITSSSLTKIDAVGTWLTFWPAAAPATGIVKAAAATVVPLILTAIAASAVVIAPPATAPTSASRPRDGTRTKAVAGEAPMLAEKQSTWVSLRG